VENSLRALLRDVLCGFLDPDLKSAADDILLRSAEPFEIEARDTRRFASSEARGERPEAAAAAPVKRYWGTAAVAEQEAESDPAPPPPPRPEAEEELSEGVTHSDDWGLDDDPESYSAPV
jgi:hypothetical protein